MSDIRGQIFTAMGGVIALALGIVIITIISGLGLVDATTSANLVSTSQIMSAFILIVGLFAVFRLLK